jgi:hypothetical protein
MWRLVDRTLDVYVLRESDELLHHIEVTAAYCS